MITRSHQRLLPLPSFRDAKLSVCQYINSRPKPLFGLGIVVALIAILAVPRTEPLPMVATRMVTAGSLVLSGAKVTRYPLARLQQSFNDCGLAVVRELLAREQISIPPETVSMAIPLNVAGISLDHLALSLSALSLPATVIRDLTYRDAKANDIALLSSHHYVLITAALPEAVRYFDPVVGLVERSRSDFEKTWTGKVVRLRKEASESAAAAQTGTNSLSPWSRT